MVHIIFRIALVVGSLSIACAQDWSREIRALRPAHPAANETAVLDRLEARARQALESIRHARTPAEADARRPELRRQLEQSLGDRKLPWPPHLQPHTVDVLHKPGYRIEKLIYQTLPGVRVPAHLYLPEKAAGRIPAVLFYNGHWWVEGKAKPDFQAFCINMARLGFAVLSFDAFGQGERGVSDRDHRRTEALLAGISQQGFAEYETRCALEYLVARPEIDPARIGMTGASGGGYNTWITAALDDRIKVAVPVVGTSEFYEQLSSCRAHDWYQAKEHCHFVAGLIRYANNHELLAMAAPRSLLIVSAAEDQSFPVTGVRQMVEYGRSLYRAYGAADQIGYFEDASAGHGYQQKKREAAYGWFLRGLMNRGNGEPYPEPAAETEPADARDLRCFPAGRNEPAGPGLHAAVKPGPSVGTPSFAAEASPRVQLRSGPLQRLEIETEPGFTVPAFLLRPETPERGVLVAVDDRGKEELASDPAICEALRSGWAVCGVDPRGIGESGLTKPGWVFAVSLLLGENFVERQGADLAQVIGGVHAQALYARGPNAALAAAYAVAHRPVSLRRFVLRDGFLSFRQFIDRPESMRASFALHDANPAEPGRYDREIPYFFFPFDVLRKFDLPDLLRASGLRGMAADPIDGDWKPMAIPDARKLLPDNVTVVCGNDVESALRRFL